MFELDEELLALREAAREFAEERILPQAPRWDAEEIFPVETLREAASLGFGGLFVREDVGGTGLSRLAGAVLFEELAAACPSTAAYISIHNMVAWMIDAFGNEAQRRRWLPDLCTMAKFASYCLTEPNAGSDAASLRTSARREGDHYVLNGTKVFISGAGASDVYVVMCRTGGEGARGISAVVVEKGTPGLSFGRNEEKLGWHSQPTATVTFEDCRVPVENRLGEEGEGFRIAMRALDGGRINIAACSLGGARACLERAVEYVQERRQFGRAIADFQNTQFRLADMHTELEAARLLTWKAAAALDAGSPDATVLAAMAKRLATETGWNVVDGALQLFGGYGYVRETGIERYLRDLRVHRILEGTNEIMRLIVARRLLGRR